MYLIWLCCSLILAQILLFLQHLKSFFALTVGPTFDLSGFRNGLEVIVPHPLTIRVPITGYPTPIAKWTFGDKELNTDERISLLTKPTFTELTIVPSMRPDKGTYTLQLENDISSVSGEIEVNVIGMKRISCFQVIKWSF